MRPVVSRPPRAPFAEQRACMCHRSPRPEVVSRASPSDLRRLRGVGRTYEALLSAQAIASIADLQAVFHQRLGADTAQLQRFLAQVVGIRNSRHCRAVAEDISQRDWEQPVLAGAEGPGGRDPGQGRITLAVEGNIGAGKSTFLSLMADGSLELQDIVEIVPEPVDEWQAVASGDNGPINLLDRFYKDPRRYAYTFQHYVLLTRMQKARTGQKPLRVLERSIFSDRMVFVRAMHESGFMQDLEVSVYDSFNMEIGQDRALTPNGFIYLKASPETCFKRLQHRARSEEVGVDPGYLGSLHQKHEDWLHFGARALHEVVEAQRQMLESVTRLRRELPGTRTQSPILEAAAAAAPGAGGAPRLRFAQPAWLVDAPESIRGSVYFLKGRDADAAAGVSPQENSIVNSLADIPALMLDHDQSDILFDPEARRDYARKVKDFSEYVSKLAATKKAQLARSHGFVEPLVGASALDDGALLRRLAELTRRRQGGLALGAALAP
ncbi:hypothetical protein QBZ16_003208 [Prototheca wickerhamii]|uniref:Deoxynucleoside kinase domain-containing protein n=1 Tax=Prototheca wickerhamii TaxID=3111 RepID=A0AAD9IHJ0_PROWI|nr:hypothetical protein QBZ16_003208 [Prototheca wickerhamii]